ncbi:hypothetical protein [Rhodohalobacter sulfatireducens]|uniref:2TM domain-containing protein n=1 Tax=Rhodohalobacter sulfatireducens TaxID=2911366 RepID=A0ABS9KD35_9BACT|nr:hypothetical protein [Rhodohalobacter sulfatireducens]MCG2588764.1 hypothetical protein [Rhodohalobacter sulfatireducens]
MRKDDVFTAMIKEEINQFHNFLKYKEKKWLREGKYSKVAQKGLRQARIMGVFVIFSILIFSFFSVYHFIDYGNTGNNISLWLGITSWIFVIISTVYYTRDILQKKKSMERILKLLDAREDYYRSKENEKKS